LINMTDIIWTFPAFVIIALVTITCDQSPHPGNVIIKAFIGSLQTYKGQLHLIMMHCPLYSEKDGKEDRIFHKPTDYRPYTA